MKSCDQDSDANASVLAVSPFASITVAPTRGVLFSARCPPVHSVLLGHGAVNVDGRIVSGRALALPVNVPHRVLELTGAHGGVAYLDARWYRFEDAEQLALQWSDFRPGHDDVRELLGDAIAIPRRRVDGRLLRALDVFASSSLEVHQAARAAKLSESRLTHLMTDTLGAPPRTWRTWLMLRRAISHAVRGSTLTEAACRAGFADSAHLTRTCKRLMGVAPARVMPKTIYGTR